METHHNSRNQQPDMDTALTAAKGTLGCCRFTVQGTTQQFGNVDHEECIERAKQAGATEVNWTPGTC